ncbi:MAG: hypothetical protein WC415_02940 [Patescibacteria group bacterium]|jgi:hypothetical protein
MIYKKLTICFAVLTTSLCLFATTLVTEAKEAKAGIANKYQNEPDFNLEKLSGPINNDNKNFRDSFYSRIEFESGKKQLKERPRDEINNTIEQCEVSIDHSLGIDFSKDKRKSIADAQRKMLAEKSILDRTIPEDDKNGYANSLSFHFEKFLGDVSLILTEEEFKALFKISKSEIGNAYKMLIQSSEDQ